MAVADLDAAVETYRTLGFALKPGTPHDNGIRNQHIKFPDGTEIELITAAEARDPLTTEYLAHLDAGDGPAFVAFHASDMTVVTDTLDRLGRPFRTEGRIVTFAEADPLRYVFFGPRNQSPTDRPEHFAHANTAESLVAVWIAGDDTSAERELLAALGGIISERDVRVPDSMTVPVVEFQHGDVVLLPASRQVVPGRRIVGATVRVRSLEAARRSLAGIDPVAVVAVETAAGSSVILPPAVTHGMWLELFEPRRR